MRWVSPVDLAWRRLQDGDHEGALELLQGGRGIGRTLERAGLIAVARIMRGERTEQIAEDAARAAEVLAPTTRLTTAVLRGAVARAAVMRLSAAETYFALGRSDQARRQAVAGFDLGDSQLGSRLACTAAAASLALGDLADSEQWARKALAVAIEHGKVNDEVDAVDALVNTLVGQQRLAEVLHVVRPALERAEARDDAGASVTLRLWLLAAYAGLEDFAAAATEWERASRLLDGSAEPAPLVGLYELVLRNPLVGELPYDAVQRLRWAVGEHRRRGDEQAAVHAQLVLAMALRAEGRSEEALDLLEPLLAQAVRPYERAAILLELADYQDDEADLDWCLEELERYGEQAGNGWVRGRAASRRGLRELMRGRPAVAAESFRRAVQALDGAAAVESRGRHAVRRSDLVHDAHTALAVALSESGDHPGALEALEAGRARVALDALLAGHGRGDASPDATRLDELYRRRAELLAELASEAAPPERRAEVRERLHDLALELDALLEGDARQAPARGALRRPDDVSAAELQRSLAGGAALEYATWLDSVLGVCVTTDAIVSRLLPIDPKQLGELVTELTEDIRKPALDLRHAHELHRLLIAPFADVLPPGGRLLWVPDGALHELPIDVLEVAPAARGTPWDERDLVLTRYVTARAPSIRVAGLLRAGAQGPYRDWTTIAAPGGHRADLPALENASAEASAVAETARAAGGTALECHGGDATREAVVRLSGRSADVLHIAAHAESHLDDPELSAVYLTPGPGDDGVWRAHQIARHRTGHRVVILSGCETAEGPGSAEGVLALSRAFMLAGAHAVLATQWHVGDADAQKFVSRLAIELGESGATAAEALCAVKRWALQEGGLDHPETWAVYTAAGPV